MQFTSGWRRKTRTFGLEPIEPRVLLSSDPLLVPFVSQPNPQPSAVELVLPTATIQWDAGGDGTSWNNRFNWTEDRLPGAADDVLVNAASTVVHSTGGDSIHSLKSVSPLVFSGGTLSIELGAEAADFTLSGGNLTGPGQVTLTGSSSWTSGSMTGSGLTIVADGSTLKLTGASDKDLVGRQLDNEGTIVWGDGRFRTGNGSVIWNKGLWDIQDSGDQLISNSDLGGAMSTFVNDGTFRRSEGSGTTFSDILFALRGGTVSVVSGTVQFRNSVTSQAGHFDVAAAGAALFSTGPLYAFNINSTFSGAGLIRLTGGTAVLEGLLKIPRLTLAGGTMDIEGSAEIADFTFNSGLLTGPGQLTLTGTSSWSGNMMTGGGKTIVAAGGTLDITTAADKDFVNRQLENNGTLRWTGGRIRTGNGSSITNNGILDIRTDQIIFNDDFGGTMSSIVNSGILKKSAESGSALIDVPLTSNGGTVSAEAGTIQLRNNVTSTATHFEASTGAAILFVSGGSNVFNTTTTFTGSGAIRILNGTDTFSGTVSTGNLEFGGGNLAGTFTVNGTLLWTGGTMISAGTLTIAAGSTLLLQGGSDKDIVGRTLINIGTVTWAGGRIRTGSGGQLINRSLWDIQVDQQMFNSDYGGAMSSFINDGTVRKSPGTGTALIDINSIQTGLVDVLSGTILFRGNLAATSATFNSRAGTVIGFGDAGYTFDGETRFTGAGINRITGSGVTFNGTVHSQNLQYAGGNLAGTFTLDGVLLWTGGTINSLGTMTIPTGSTLILSGGNDKDIVGKTIDNFGTVTWAGGRIRTGGGAQLLNHGLWDIQVDQPIFNSDLGGTMSAFVNDGTLKKSSGGGTTNIAITVTNSAAVQTLTGALLFTGNTENNAGTFDASTGTLIGFGNAGYTFNNGTEFKGAGSIRITGGGATFTGTIHSQNLEFAGGNLSGTFTLDGTLLWTGGTIISPGTLTIPNGSTLTLAGGSDKDIVGKTIDNFGSVIWAGGRFRTGFGTQLRNHGLWDIQVDQILFNNDYGGNMSTFTNDGIMRKSAGSGGANIAITVSNSALVENRSGNLFFTGNTDNSGTFDVVLGSQIVFGNAGYSFNDGTVFNGAGVNRIVGGSVSFSGNINTSHLEFTGGNIGGSFTVAGTMLWTGGTMLSAGTLTIADGSVLTMAGGSDKDFVGRTLENFGTVIWAGGRFRTGFGTQLHNLGLWDIQVDQSMFNSDYGGNMSTFTNDGTLLKSAGGGAAGIAITVSNNGHIENQSGTIFFSGSTDNSGTFNTSANTLISFGGAGLLFKDGSILSGFGVNRITSGTVTLAGTVNASNLEFTGGNLEGSFTLQGSMLWTGGTIISPGIFTIAAGATLTMTGSSDKDIVGRTIENFGTVVWAGGRLRTGFGSQLRNHGLWELQADQSVFNSDYGGNMSTFSNDGTLRKSSGTGTTRISIPFDSSGTVDLRTGTLFIENSFGNFSGGDTLSGGIWIVAGRLMWSGARVAINNAAVVLDGLTSAITDPGGNDALEPYLSQVGSGGVLELRNGRNFTTIGGFTNLGTLHVGSGSVFQVQGPLTLGPSSRLILEITGTAPGNIGLVDVTGTAALSGILAAAFASGFTATVGDVLTVVHFTSSTGAFNGFEGLVLPSGMFFGAQVLAGSVVLVANRSPLTVVNISPFGFLDHEIGSLDATFNQAIDPASLSTADITLTGPAGIQPISSVQFVSGNVWRFNFAALQADGSYSVRIGPDILDVRGIPMNQDLDAIAGEAEDNFSGSFTLDRAPPIADVVNISPGLIVIHFLDTGGLDTSTLAIASNYVLTSGAAALTDRIRNITFTPDATGATVRLDIQPSLGAGIYELTIVAAGIRDLAGNSLNGGANSVTQDTLAPAPIDPPSGIVGWWRAAGDATDDAGLNNATLRNGASITAGLVGQAFALDGVDDFVELPANPALLGLTQGTIELWTRIFSLDENQVRLFSVSDQGPVAFNSDSWGIDYRSTGAIEVYLINAGQIVMAAFTPAGTIHDTNFHHVAVVADGANPIQVYVDGVLQPLTAPFSTTADRFFGHATRADTISIGGLRRDTLFAEGAKGIDELSIYNRPLSAAEIQSIVAAGGAGKRALENNPGPANELRINLNDGLTALFGQLPNWLSLFNLDQFVSAVTGLPLFQLPVVTMSLNNLFGLASRVGSAPVPSISEVTGTDDLIQKLRAAGFTVLSIVGGSEDVPAGIPGELIRVSLPVVLGSLTSATSGSNTINDATPGVLSGITPTASIHGNVSWIGDLNLSLEFGIDANGFFVSEDSQFELDVDGNGAVSGNIDFAGHPLLSVNGTASADLTAGLALTRTLRINDLNSSPLTYFRPLAAGTASLAIDHVVAGPLDFSWRGDFTASTSAAGAISLSVASALSGTLAIPFLKSSTTGDPLTITLIGSFSTADQIWTLTGTFSGTPKLGGFALGPVNVTVKLQNSTLSGTLSTRLITPFGDQNINLAEDADISFDPGTLTLNRDFNIGTKKIGSALSLEGVVLHVSFSGNFDTGAFSGSIGVNATTAALLPGTGSGFAHATGLSGSLNSAGKLVLNADAGDIALGGGVRLLFGDSDAATPPGLEITLDPAETAVDAAIATIRQLRLDFPGTELSGLKFLLDSTQVDSFTVRRNGADIALTFAAASAWFGAQANPFVTITNPRLTLSLGVTASSTTLGEFTVTPAIALSATSATLFPGIAGQTFSTSLTGITGSISLPPLQIQPGTDPATIPLNPVVHLHANAILVTVRESLLRLDASNVDLTIDPAHIDADTVLATISEAHLSSPDLPRAPPLTLTGITIRRNGITIGNATLGGPGTNAELGSNPVVLSVPDFTLKVSNLSLNVSDAGDITGSIGGTVEFSASSATLFPSLTITASVLDDNSVDSLPGLHGVFDLVHGGITITARKFTASVAGVFELTALPNGATPAVTIHLGSAILPGDDVLHVAHAIAAISALGVDGTNPATGQPARLTPTIEFSDFGLRANGNYFLAGAVGKIPDGYTSGLGVAGLLPVEVDNITVDFPDPDNIDSFLLSVDGRFLIANLQQQLGFTPVIRVGSPATEYSAANNGAFSFQLNVQSLKNGIIEPVDFGPITIGVADLVIPDAAGFDVTFAGEITLGGYIQGIYQPNISGFFTVTGSNSGSSIQAGARVNFTGTLVPTIAGGSLGGGGTLSLDGILALTVNGDGSPVTGSAAFGFHLGIRATVTTSSPFISIIVDRPQLTSVHIANLVIDLPSPQNSVVHVLVEAIDLFLNTPGPQGEVAKLTGLTLTLPDFPGFEAHIAEALVFRNPNRLVITGAGLQLSGSIGASPTLMTFEDLRLTMNLAILFDGDIADQTTWGNFTLDPTATNTVKISALSASLFPDEHSFFTAEVNPDGIHTTDNPEDPAWKGISGSLNLVTGEMTLRAGDFHLLVANILEVKAQNILFHFGPSTLDDRSAEIASLEQADLFLLPMKDANGDPFHIVLNDLSIRGDGFTLGSATFIAGDLPPPAFENLFALNDLTVTVTDVVFNTATGFHGGSLVVSASSANLLSSPGRDSLILLETFESIPGFRATLTSGAFTIESGRATLTIGDIFLATANHPEIHLGPAATEPVFLAETIQARIPVLPGLAVTLSNLQLDRKGNLDLTGVTVNVSGLSAALGIAEFLPFDLDGVAIAIGADANHDGVRDDDTNGDGIKNPGETWGFTDFAITTEGHFNFAALADLPFTPILRIGDQNNLREVTEDTPESESSFTFTIIIEDNGRHIRLQDFGPVTIGFEDLVLGPVTLEGTITLGGYQDGAFVPTFGGHLAIAAGFDDIEGEAAIDLTGRLDLTDPTPQQEASGIFKVATLTLDGTFTISFRFGEVIEVKNAALHFSLATSARLSTNPDTFDVSLDDLAFAGLDVELIRIAFGDVVTMQSTGIALDFNPDPGKPLFKAETLSVLFGDPDDPTSDNPLNGWSGTAGPIGIGMHLENGEPRVNVYLLDGFGVTIHLGDGEKLGLPDWVPLEVRNLGFRFNEGALGDGGADLTDEATARRFVDLTLDSVPFTVTFSGGLKITESWPISAQLDGLEVDLHKLLVGEFPITNLDGIEVLVAPFEIGPVTIGGGFGLHLLRGDDGEILTTPANPALGIPELPVIYGRIVGQFSYDGIGVGVDIVVSQYGPVLARLLAGAPIPIGLIVGALVGSVVPGVGTAAGASIGDRTGFILTGFEGGFVFDGKPLPHIEDPVDILYNHDIHFPLAISTTSIRNAVQKAAEEGVFTWNRGFTFAISGVLTNTYVAGMIGAKVTLGANIGFDLSELPSPVEPPADAPPGGVGAFVDSVGFQLFGIGDLQVIGMPLASVGLMFDFDDPLNPVLDMAFALPGSPGSPLALILPVRATFGVQLKTEGIVEGIGLAVQAFVQKLADGALPIGQEFFNAVLNEVAGRLQSNHVKRLSQILLDVDGHNGVDAAENQVVITAALLRTRFQNLSADVDVFANAADAFMTELLNVGFYVINHPEQFGTFTDLDAVLNDPFFATITELMPADSPQRSGAKVLAAIARVIGQAMLEPVTGNTGLTILDTLNPSLTIKGYTQPVILGIPFGASKEEVVLTIDKTGVTFSMKSSVLSWFFGFGSVILERFLMVPDLELTLGFSLPIGSNFTDILKGTAPLRIDALDKNWGASIEGDISIGGFHVASVTGLLVTPSMSPDEVNTFLADRIQKAFDPITGEPDLTAHIAPGKIPIDSQERYDTILTHGGLLLYGRIDIPRLITDPLAVVDALAQLDPRLPQDPLELITWVTQVAPLLTQVDRPASIQMYIPSPLHVMESLVPPDQVEHIRQTLANGSQADANALFTNLFGDIAAPLVDRTNAAVEELLNDAYLEGNWDAKLFSVPLGSGHIELTEGTGPAATRRLQVTALDPLIGLRIQVDLGFRPVTLATGETVQLPVGSAQVTIDPSDLDSMEKIDAMLVRLGLPAGLISRAVNSAGDAEASFRAYTPGFSGDPAETDRLKIMGGFGLTSHLRIASLIDDAIFDFEIPLFDPGATGLNIFTPDYSARAAVEHLTIPGLTVDSSNPLLSLKEFEATIQKTGNSLTLGLNGALNVLGTELSVDGQLNIINSSRPFFAGLTDQILGNLNTGIRAAVNGMVADAIAVAQPSATTVDRIANETATLITTIDTKLHALSASIANLGSINQAAIANLVNAASTDIQARIQSFADGLKADPTLATAISIINAHQTALLNDVPNALSTLPNQVLNAWTASTIDGSGVAGYLTLSGASGPTFALQGVGFSITGTGRLELNTTGNAVTLAGHSVQPGGRIHVDGTLTTVGVTLSGSFDLSVGERNGTRFVAVAVNATRAEMLGNIAAFTFAVQGGFEISALGLAGRLSTSSTQSQSGALNFTLSGSVVFEVNTTNQAVATLGLDLPAGPYFHTRLTGHLATMGLDLAGTFGFTRTGNVILLDASASINLNVGQALLYRYGVAGQIQLSDKGLAARITLQQKQNNSSLFGFSMSGSTTTLEINTTGTDITNFTPTLLGNGGPYARVVLTQGVVTVVGMEVTGTLALTVKPTEVSVALSGGSVALKATTIAGAATLFSVSMPTGTLTVGSNGIAGSLNGPSASTTLPGGATLNGTVTATILMTNGVASGTLTVNGGLFHLPGLDINGGFAMTVGTTGVSVGISAGSVSLRATTAAAAPIVFTLGTPTASLSITGSSIAGTLSGSGSVTLAGGATLTGSFTFAIAMSGNSAVASLAVSGGLLHVPGLDISAGFSMTIGTTGVAVVVNAGNISLKASLAANAPNLFTIPFPSGSLTLTNISISGSIGATVSAGAPINLAGGATLTGTFAFGIAMSGNSAVASLAVSGGLLHVPGLDISAGFSMTIGTTGVAVVVNAGNISLKASLAANAPNLFTIPFPSGSLTLTNISISGSIGATVSAGAPINLAGGATLTGTFAFSIAMSGNSAVASLAVSGGLLHVPGLDISAGFSMTIGTTGVAVVVNAGNISLKASLAANAPNLFTIPFPSGSLTLTNISISGSIGATVSAGAPINLAGGATLTGSFTFGIAMSGNSAVASLAVSGGLLHVPGLDISAGFAMTIGTTGVSVTVNAGNVSLKASLAANAPNLFSIPFPAGSLTLTNISISGSIGATVSAGAPINLAGGATLTGSFTFAIAMSGNSAVASLAVSGGLLHVPGLDISAGFAMTIGTTGVSVTVNAGNVSLKASLAANAPNLFSIPFPAGSLTLTNISISGSIGATVSAGAPINLAGGATLTGSFTFAIAMSGNSAVASLAVSGGLLHVPGLDISAGFAMTIGTTAVSVAVNAGSISLRASTASTAPILFTLGTPTASMSLTSTSVTGTLSGSASVAAPLALPGGTRLSGSITVTIAMSNNAATASLGVSGGLIRVSGLDINAGFTLTIGTGGVSVAVNAGSISLRTSTATTAPVLFTLGTPTASLSVTSTSVTGTLSGSVSETSALTLPGNVTLSGSITVTVTTTNGTATASVGVTNGIVRALGLEVTGGFTLTVGTTAVSAVVTNPHAVLKAGTTTVFDLGMGATAGLTLNSVGMTATLGPVSFTNVAFGTGGTPGPTLSGTATVQINTTLTTGAFARVTVTNGLVRVLGMEVSGGFTLTVGTSAVTVGLTNSSVALKAGTATVLNFSIGSGLFEARSGGIVARFSLTHGADVIGSSLSGTATLEVNTTSSLITFFNSVFASLPAGTARVHLVGSLGVSVATATGSFDFSVGSGVISVATTNVTLTLFGQTLSAGGSFTMGASGDFSATLSSNHFDVGVFLISGTLAFQRVGGVFQIAILGTPGPRGSTTPPRIEIPGIAFALTLDTFAVRSDGTFDVAAHINGTLGSSSLGLSATSIVLHKTGASLDTFSMAFAGGSLSFLGTTINVGSFSLNNGGGLAGSVDPPDFDLGSFHFKTGRINFGPGDGHALQFWLIDSATITLMGGSLTVSNLYFDSDGNFSMGVSGNLKINGHPLASANYNVTRINNVLTFTLPSATHMELGFMGVDVTGYVSSNGDFFFSGSAHISINSSNNTSVDGTASVTLRNLNGIYNFTGSFSGSAKLNGESFGGASGSFSEGGHLHVAASKSVTNQFTGTVHHVYGSADIPMPGGSNSGSFSVSVTFDGYISGATVFLDANQNGILDFVDSNGNGVQETTELSEPSTTTTGDGLFVLFLPPEFDTNGNGILEPAEGRIVVFGGFDTTTLLPLDVPMIAAADSSVVSPLTTLAMILGDQEGLTTAESYARVLLALGLPNVDLATFDPIAEALDGNILGAQVFAALAQVEDTVAALGQFIHGASGASIGDAGMAAYSALAELARTLTSPLTLSNTGMLATLIDAAATLNGATIDPSLVSAAASVIAAGNQQIAGLTPAANANYLKAIAHIQSATQGSGAADLAEAAAGTLTITDLIQHNTGAGLTTKIENAVIGEVLPLELTINEVTVTEGNSGVSTVTFTIKLSAPSVLPVTVSLETADGTASAAAGDYTTLATALTFAPGETVKTMAVEIAGDIVVESDETFYLQLRSAIGAHIDTFQGRATLINDDLGIPVAVNDTASTTELLPMTIVVLANDTGPGGSQVAASVEIENGPAHGSVVVNATGTITYTPDVEFAGIDNFRYVVKNDNGAVSNIATVTVTVAALPEKSARLQSDPVEPGLQALIVKGTSHDDDIRVVSEGNGRVKVMIGNKSLGNFTPTGRVIILGGNGNDEIDADGKFAVPVEIHGGSGNDYLNGPSSSAILIGGSGNDTLIGGSGRDLLIGGTGSDRLFGKSADDLLIGGWTRFDDNAAALASIFSTWTRKDLTFGERVKRLHFGLLNSDTVFDDHRNDCLFGGSGIDWTLK